MKKKIIFICVVLNILFFSVAIFSQDRISRIDEFILKSHQNKELNGVIFIAENRRKIYSKAIGLANIEWNVPHKIDSKFKIASVSKQFTCMLILQLVNEGKIKLDTKVIDYLPDYPVKQGSRISIRNLMSHSSGIPNYTNFKNWYSELWIKEYSTKEFINLFKNLELEFEPGNRFNYSNSGYRLLTAIIEKICKKPFNQVINERIFKPLNMKDSGCIDINTIVPKLAYPYEYWKSKFTRSDYFNPTTAVGVGSIYSTAADLWKWHKALMDNKLISKKLTNEMLKKQVNITDEIGYGFGLSIGKVKIKEKKYDFIEHTGAYPGFNTLYVWFPQEKRLILIFNNTGHTKLRFIRNELIKILDGD